MLRPTYIAFLCCSLALSGCVSLGSKKDSNTEVPDAKQLISQQLPSPATTAEQSYVPTYTSILKLINNANLNALVVNTLNSNLDMQVAALRLQQLQLESGLVNNTNQPSLNLSTSSQSNNGTSAASLNLNLAWEMDVWGRLAQQQDQASADTLVAKLDYVSAQNSLASRVIQAWLDIVYRQHIIVVEEQWLASLKTTQASVQERFLHGDGNLAELESAKASTARTEASLSARRQKQKDAWRLLGQLQGHTQVSSFAIPRALPDIAAPNQSINADILINRPDVTIAYQQIIAANADKALAQKALLPSFSLSASVSNSGTSLDDLLSGSMAWNLLGNLTQPLFDGNRLKTDVEIKHLQLEQAYLGFQNTYLAALHEATGLLEQETALQQQETQMRLAWQHAEASLKHYRNGYLQGINDILPLLSAQQNAFSAHIQLLQTQQSRLANRINLGLALGMGV